MALQINALEIGSVIEPVKTLSHRSVVQL